MAPQVGQLVNNKYLLVRLIGDGGMGSVWEAKHELLGTKVALKFLHEQLGRRKGLVERFLQEAQVSARINSPHVVRVSDVDRSETGLAFMVMELVEGRSLQAHYEELYQRGERLGYGDAFSVMLQLCEGVAAAHRLGIVHRDLKPDNVMLAQDDKGRTLVKILDFGIAKLRASGEMDRGLTRPGVVMGTPEYMAPEQAFSADAVDARADIFSLGVMFFELLCGRRPVGGDNAHAIAAQYLEGNIVRLRELKPTVAVDLEAALGKAMAGKPDDRFASVEELQAAIEPFAPEGSGRAASAPSALASTPPAGPSLAGPNSQTDQPQPAPSGALAPSSAPSSPPHRLPSESMGAPNAGDPRAAAAATPIEAPMVLGSRPPGDRLGASTEKVEVVPAMGAVADASFGATELAMAGAGRSAGAATMVGDLAGPTGGPGVLAAEAKLYTPDYAHAGMMAPQRMGRGRKNGPSMLSILAIAGALSALVVGGLYFAQSHARDADVYNDEPTPRRAAQTVPARDTMPPADVPPSVPATSPPVLPSAHPANHPTPPNPEPRPSNTPPHPPPTSTPTIAPFEPPPLVIPTALPTIPGLPPFPPLPGFPPFPGAQPPPPSQPPHKH